jgi:hypothetical protein
MEAMTLLLAMTFAAVLGSTTPAKDDRAAAVQLAQATLARALSVAEDRVRVDEVRAGEWPDAALGCPEKGKQYAQAIVSGYDVRMDVGGAAHHVHVAAGHAVFCERALPSEAPKYLQVAAQVQELARRDLAMRLKVEVKDVKVMRLRPMTWPDASLGCPERDRSYETVETRGFLIELRHADKTYLYHSDRQRVVLCPGP